MELVLEAGHTHLYPGHEGVVADGGLLPAASPIHARILFADGSVALAALTPERGSDWSLSVDPYRTAAGTGIAAKRWAVSFTKERAVGMRFRIRKKLPA